MVLTKNLRAKVLAVLFALAFWVYVVSVGEKIRAFPEPIDIQMFNVPENTVVVNEENVTQAKVSVLALDEDFAKLTKEDLSAYIDVSGIEVGSEHAVPVNVTLKNPNVKLYRVDPAKLTVRLDESTSKSMTVESETEGSVAEGYTLGTVDAGNKKVRVEGAKSLVEHVSRVVAHLKLNGDEKETIERQVQLIALDDVGKPISQVTIIPASVIVQAAVEQVTHTKTVGVVVHLSTAAPAAGHWIKEVTVTPSSVQVEGDPAVLSRLENLSTEEVDVAGIDDDFTRVVPLVLPSGISLTPGLPKQVTVTVTLSNEKTKREIFAGVKLSNMPAGLSAEKVDPGSVKVTIAGPLPIVRDIAESSVNVTLDATGATIGKKRYYLEAGFFSVPSGVTVETFDPREIDVTFVAQTAPVNP